MPDKMKTRCFRGTVTQLLKGCGNCASYRAIMETSDGQRIQICSQVELGVKPGDDFVGVGTFYPAGTRHRIAELKIAPKQDANLRMQQMAGAGGKMQSFGKTAGALARPGLIAWLKRGMINGGMVKAEDGFAVLPANTETDDAILAWGRDLMADLKADQNATRIVMIDSQALEAERIKGALPARYQDFASALEADLGLRAGSYRKTDSALVIPFNPYETHTSFFQRRTGLDVNAFAPKMMIAAADRQKFTMAAELAGALAEDYSFGPVRNLPSSINLYNSFKDVFAVLATAKSANGKTDTAEQVLLMSRAAVISGKFDRATYAALGVAINFVKDQKKAGKLAGMSTDDMLKAAKNIAFANYMREHDMALYARARAGIYQPDSQRGPEGSEPASIRGDLFHARLKTELKKKQHNLGTLTARFEQGVAAIQALAYTPHDLFENKAREAAFDLYKKDVKDTFMKTERGHSAIRRLANHEMITHAKQGLMVEGASSMGMFAKYDPTAVSGARAQLIDNLSTHLRDDKAMALKRQPVIAIPKAG